MNPFNDDNMDKQKLDKWNKWIEVIFNECLNLKDKSYFYREYLEIVKNNQGIASPRDFHDWVASNYYEAVLMNIRRLVDDHKDVVSLKNLLTDIVASPNIIIQNNNAISDIKTKEDIIKLGDVEKKLSFFIDNTLAHRNKGGKGKQSIQTKEIEDSILEVEKIMIKYLDLFGKGGFITLESTWTNDWQTIFMKPWII